MDIYEEYFEWLCSLVGLKVSPGGPYYIPLNCMFETDFLVLVPNDINRKEDGLELRERFAEAMGYSREEFDESEYPCSVLEMLIALCDRMVWEMVDSYGDNSRHRWFMEILKNLRIDKYTSAERTAQIIKIANERLYDDDGNGGYFPVKTRQKRLTKNDELWYQMQHYLIVHYFN